MTRSIHLRARSALALLSAFTLLAAGCGSDKKSSATTAAVTTVAPSTTASAGTTPGSGSTAPTDSAAGTTPGSADGTTPASAAPGTAGCPTIDSSIDAVEGTNAGRFLSDIACADKAPLKAVGDPITIGFQNPEGDPNGSFPEATLAAQAAVEYINNELGGLGADIQNGKPGRPVKLEVCKMAISPDDSQRCANELSAKAPALVISSFNFFGNQFPIYAAAKIPVIVGSPVTIGDYTSPGVYAIGGGGGCLGAHTALMYFATHQLKGKKIGIPWADTPPGVVCYYDLEAKPLDVLTGKVASTSKEAGSIPDLTYLGVPIKPATPDITAQITQILDFKPDVITFSAQSADCWNLVAVLGRLGWTSAKIPLVMTGSCVDLAAMRAAGDLAKGIYFITSGSGVLSDPASSTNVRAKAEAINYQTKPEQYGLAKDTSTTGFATLGWGTMMSLWEISSEVAVSGQDVTGDNISAFYKATTNQHSYASTPLACAKAPTPYVAVCNSDATVSQWDGTNLVQVADRFTGIDLVAGTPLKPGP